MKKYSLLICAMLIALFVSCFGGIACAAQWDGQTKTPVKPAQSKDSNGYRHFNISNGAELAWLADEVNKGNPLEDAYINIVRDIDLGGHPWTPIGTGVVSYQTDPDNPSNKIPKLTSEKPFEGYVNGNGHTISGLSIDKPDENAPQGLFGCLKGSVWELNVNGTVNGKCFVGGVAGYMHGMIQRCQIDMNVTGKYYVGGFAGYIDSTEYVFRGGVSGAIKPPLCLLKAVGTVKGGRYFGGMFGYSKTPNLFDSLVSQMTVTGVSSGTSNDGLPLDGYYGGGIGGSSDGEMQRSVYEKGSISASGYAGGLVGEQRSGSYKQPTTQVNFSSHLFFCVSNAVVSGNSATTGAIAGSMEVSDTQNNRWNSSKTTKAYGQTSNEFSGLSAVQFTDVSSIFPVTFLFDPMYIDVKLGREYTVSVDFFPTGASVTEVKMKWDVYNSSQYVAMGPTDTTSLRFKMKKNTKFSWNAGSAGMLYIKVSQLSTSDSFKSPWPLNCWIHMADHAEPVTSPTTPDGQGVVAKKALFITEMESVPEDIRPFLEYRSDKVIPSVNAIIRHIKDNKEYSSLYDINVDPQGIPAFTADVENNKTVLATFSTKLNEFLSTPFNKICIVKILADGRLKQFTVNQDLKTLTSGQFCISNIDGSAIDPTATPEEGKDYLIGVAVQDGTQFDVGAELGDVLDPAFLMAAKETVKNDTPAVGADNGGGGGCNAGIAVLALLMAPFVLRGFYLADGRQKAR